MHGLIVGPAAPISTHAPAGGATVPVTGKAIELPISTHAPAGGATKLVRLVRSCVSISTHAPAGGATWAGRGHMARAAPFLLTPLREGRPLVMQWGLQLSSYFYSRPCGRGDAHAPSAISMAFVFLLTPLREGRRHAPLVNWVVVVISTHAPAGGATGRIRHQRGLQF